MSKITVEESNLSAIADFIRSKGGTSGSIEFPNGFISSIANIPISKFATGVVSNVTAGQQMTVTGINDEKTGEAFDIKGVLCYIQPSSSTNIYPAGHAPGVPAAFCFVRDYTRNFGLAMAGHADDSTSTEYLRQVRLNVEVGSTGDSEKTLTFSGNSFIYKARSDMWGLIAAPQWRWIAWG